MKTTLLILPLAVFLATLTGCVYEEHDHGHHYGHDRVIVKDHYDRGHYRYPRPYDRGRGGPDRYDGHDSGRHNGHEADRHDSPGPDRHDGRDSGRHDGPGAERRGGPGSGPGAARP